MMQCLFSQKLRGLKQPLSLLAYKRVFMVNYTTGEIHLERFSTIKTRTGTLQLQVVREPSNPLALFFSSLHGLYSRHGANQQQV
jgi:hypothetical protein